MEQEEFKLVWLTAEGKKRELRGDKLAVEAAREALAFIDGNRDVRIQKCSSVAT